MQFRSQYLYSGKSCANIGGYVDTLGNEYALVCLSDGLSILNVTNPNMPYQIKFISGPSSTWREVKTYKQFAYLTTEGGSGLQIVDLSGLPDTTILYKHWMTIIGTDTLKTAHALHVDTAKGFVYLFGSNLANGGAIVADISDPWNPVYVGQYNLEYIHDGYVDNDTLYAGNIFAGHFSVIDFTNKSAPALLQIQTTPGGFTHNTWLSDNRKTLFTTDEPFVNSYLAAYDISDLSNITELDRLQSNPGSNSVVHNVHMLNDYAVCSWYRDGVAIVDAHRPSNLVIVANYDTYASSGSGHDGVWGVYPYLPSGNLLVASIDGKFFVMTPTYVRACYLEGTIRDSISGNLLFGAEIEIITANTKDKSNLQGKYAIGTHSAGTYTIQVSKPGYHTKIVTGVSLSSALVTNLDVQLKPFPSFTFGGQVLDTSGNGIKNAKIVLESSQFNYSISADSAGYFSSPPIFADSYTIAVGAWGYITKCIYQTINTSIGTFTVTLDNGYYDDFSFDNNWIVSGNASGGMWVRDKPVLTNLLNINDVNPGIDSPTDCSDYAFVTGNGGGGVETDDVDMGYTTLTSPVMDLSGYSNPQLIYSRWIYNKDVYTGLNTNDSLLTFITNGTTTVKLETSTQYTSNHSSWILRKYKLANYLPITSTMQFIIYVVDHYPYSILEGGLDEVKVENYINLSVANDNENEILTLYPNPATNILHIHLDKKSDGAINMEVYNLTGQKVKQLSVENTQSIEMNTSDLESGIYLLTISNGANFLKKKFVKTNE